MSRSRDTDPDAALENKPTDAGGQASSIERFLNAAEGSLGQNDGENIVAVPSDSADSPQTLIYDSLSGFEQSTAHPHPAETAAPPEEIAQIALTPDSPPQDPQPSQSLPGGTGVPGQMRPGPQSSDALSLQSGYAPPSVQYTPSEPAGPDFPDADPGYRQAELSTAE